MGILFALLLKLENNFTKERGQTQGSAPTISRMGDELRMCHPES